MSKLTAWLIRHGESMANTGIWTPHPETSSLTEKGKREALQAAEQIQTSPDLLIVSPATRAQESALPILKRFPNTREATWPIQEFTYLSPNAFWQKTVTERNAAKESYWQRADPNICDNEDAESFAQFMQRLIHFHTHLLKQSGFVVVVGHGQFFRAFELGLQQGFAATPAWMRTFRKMETANPLVNGGIIRLQF